MESERLGKRRANRGKSWAYVCLGLFGPGDDGEDDE